MATSLLPAPLITAPMVLTVALLASTPLWLSAVGLYQYLALEIIIWMMFALGHNLLLGHGGLPSFGHGAYFGLGAYALGLLQLRAGAGLLVSLLGAVLLSALLGAAVAAFISHRRGIYYALLTIAFGQIFWFVAIKWHTVTGGEDGLLGIKRLPLSLFGFKDLALWGFGQPAADGLKFIFKEEYTPAHVDKRLYIIAPIIILAAALAIFAVIPFGSMLPPVDAFGMSTDGKPVDLVVVPGMDVGMIFVFALSSIAVYGVILGGWASNNKYSFLGGLRSSAQLIAYELPMGLGILGVVLAAGSLNLEKIMQAQVNGPWFAIAQPLGFIVFVIAAFAEAARLPFDLPEAEQELIGGYHTEYAGMKLLLFLVAEFLHMITASFLIDILFLGGWHFPFITGAADAEIGWFTAIIRLIVFNSKIFLVIVFFMLVRWSWPRFRYDQLMSLANRETKATESPSRERAIAKVFSLGVSTNRDDWVIDLAEDPLLERMKFFIARYGEVKPAAPDYESVVKWSRNLKRRFEQGRREAFSRTYLKATLYRPFVAMQMYDSPLFVDERGATSETFPDLGAPNKAICVIAGDRQPFTAVASGLVPNLNLYSADATKYITLWRFDTNGQRTENITDWALKQFQQHYHPGPGRKPAAITKEAIFHYVYAVLHDPLYREKYAQNLKREFPRVPLYGSTAAHFEQWAAWGAELMQLHIGYETVEAWPLTCTDTPDTKARAVGQSPKSILKSFPDERRISIDSETTLGGIPPQAWHYKLGNRSALDWVLDQHKERKPKDPTIREKFDTYRFADHKERVITLLARVARVSMETVRLVEALKGGPR